MAQTITVIVPTGSAVASQVPQETFNYVSVIVAADNLATTETVPLWLLVGNTWKRVTDAAGANVALTSSVSAYELIGGPVYGFTKDLTAGPCGVYLTAGSRHV